MAGRGDRRALHGRVEAERGVRQCRDERTRFDIAGVEGLQWVVHGDPVAHRAALGDGGGIEGVEQLCQRNRRRALLTRMLVGAGVGDHQGLGGRADGVQQQLAVLGADVALAGHRLPSQRVIAVRSSGAREDGVVEADQADHPMRYRPHRHHGAHGQRPGAEVGPGGTAGQVPAEQLGHVRQPQLGLIPWPGGGHHIVEFPLQLAELPGVGVLEAGDQPDAVGQRGEPLAQRPGAAERVHDGLQTCAELRQPTGQFDAVAADVVERQGGLDPGLRVIRQCHPGQDPVQPEPPGVVDEVDAVGTAVPGVETPSDIGLPHPVGDIDQVVVGESEASPDRGGVGDVEDLGGGHPASGQGEQLGGHRQQRIGLHQ